jgi:cell division protein FtsW
VQQDRGLFISLVGVLLGFGVLMVHSASITSWPTQFEQIYLSRHIIFVAVGVGAAVACASLPARFWDHVAPYLLAACVLLLVLVSVPGIGAKVNGAQRWLRVGPLSMQPSELTKIALPLFVCRQICRHGNRPFSWTLTLSMFLPVLLVAALVFRQPDLGTALFLAAGCMLVLFVGGWPLRRFVLAGCLLGPFLAFLVAMKPYQVRRITGFLAAWTDLEQAPYQLKQSLVSLGAGGLYGVGLGKGWQKLSFLPEANTDFVFAVVGEELGLVGTLSLVALWLALYVVGLRLLRPLQRSSFAFIGGFTLLTQLLMQAALNVAVATALVPPKGIPHPLLSYGGSNLVVSLVSIGIIVSLSRAGQPTRSTGEPDLVNSELRCVERPEPSLRDAAPSPAGH